MTHVVHHLVGVSNVASGSSTVLVTQIMHDLVEAPSLKSLGCSFDADGVRFGGGAKVRLED